MVVQVSRIMSSMLYRSLLLKRMVNPIHLDLRQNIKPLFILSELPSMASLAVIRPFDFFLIKIWLRMKTALGSMGCLGRSVGDL